MRLIPNRNFRKQASYSQTNYLFRIYRRERHRKSKKFRLWASFETLEAAKKYGHSFNNTYEFVIKKVEVIYNEVTCDQSIERAMGERLPELEGFI